MNATELGAQCRSPEEAEDGAEGGAEAHAEVAGDECRSHCDDGNRHIVIEQPLEEVAPDRSPDRSKRGEKTIHPTLPFAGVASEYCPTQALDEPLIRLGVCRGANAFHEARYGGGEALLQVSRLVAQFSMVLAHVVNVGASLLQIGVELLKAPFWLTQL